MNDKLLFISSAGSFTSSVRDRRKSVRGNRNSTSALVTSIRMSAPINYGRIQHAGVLVKDTETAKQFYMSVFGMEDEDHLRNPKLPFNGSFLRAGSSQIHLMELPNPDPKDGRPDHVGRYVFILFDVQLLTEY